ncbi:MAG TPA: TolC family protein [Terriglobia bacterium]|nr:TolC family protein [Terriglobia bacterium]
MRKRNDCHTAWALQVVVLLCGCIYQPAAFAQQPHEVESIAQVIPVAINPGGQMPLSLSEAIQMALANNKDIEMARQNVLAADWDVKGAFAAYDPRSTFSSFYEHTRTPVASFLSGGLNGSVEQSALTAAYRLEGSVARGGGTYEMNVSSQRLSTNNIFASLNPQYPSEVSFRYTQPLGRGRNFSTRLRDIEIAKKNVSLTDAQFRQSATQTIVTVQRAYWDLVFARSNLAIQGDVLRDIRGQLEHNERRAAAGTFASIDVVGTEARVAESEQRVYGALEEATRAENALKNLIAENSSARLWNVSLIPKESVNPNPSTVTLESALAAAMDNRLELQETDVIREINAVQERYYRDQTRPQIDLVGSYGIVGLGGSFVDTQAIKPLLGLTPGPLPDFLEGGYGQSLANLAQNRFNNVRVGIQINLPLRNRTAEAQLGRTTVERQRLATQQEKLKQLVQMDVRNALQAVHVAESRQRAATTFRTSLEQQYASEQRRLNVGYSTTYLVLERQIGLAAARLNELRAQTEQNKALAELQRAMGTALLDNSIAVRSRD